jgi:hypothetical protein
MQYIAKGRHRKAGAIGIFSNFQTSIEAGSEDEARKLVRKEQYASGYEHVNIRTCIAMDNISPGWGPGTMLNTVKLLGTSLELQKGQRVQITPAINQPDKTLMFAKPIDGSWGEDSILLQHGDWQVD